MRKFCLAIGLAVALSACSKRDAIDIPAGTDVTVHKKDGVEVAGRLVEVKADTVVLRLAGGETSAVPRTEIASVKEVAARTPSGSPKPDAAVGTDGEAKTPSASSVATQRARARVP